MRAAFFFGVPTFALVPADNVFSATLVSFAAGLGLFGLLCDDFLVGFLDGFLGTFFAAGFFAVFLALFVAAFLAFFTKRLLVLVRLFRTALLGSFLLSRRHHDFLYCSNATVGNNRRRVYRVASASSPNTEKTSGFRSRLYSAVSRAARLIFSHTSASRARRGRLALALASSARKRWLTQRSTLSMNAASATRSLPPSASPRA